MKILIAEDDANFRRLLQEILVPAGYEVEIKENGRLAWEHLQQAGADMAILDINMPELTGFEVLRRIRSDERLRGLPVIIFTIKDMNTDQIEGYDSGADDYIVKPFDPDLFLMKIKTLERRAKRAA